MTIVKIGNRKVGCDEPPFIVAEMSGNHNQSLAHALEIVRAAGDCNVAALKLQTYTADTMTLQSENDEFRIDEEGSIWRGKYLFDLYREAHTPWEWHPIIFEEARKRDLISFSAPFDETAVDFLQELNVPAFKIASFENVDIPLIKKVAETGKPIIISTGMASVAEIGEAVETVRNANNDQIVLLKCTSTYPAEISDSNVLTIPHMRDLFQCEVGLSDHTLGTGAAIAAIANGATMIEKHFTLDSSDGGVDSSFSLEPKDMKSLVLEGTRAWNSLGDIKYGPTKSENAAVSYRRSIYISSDLTAGDKLTVNNIKKIRPGYGLACKYFELVLGRIVSTDVRSGTPLSWDLLV